MPVTAQITVRARDCLNRPSRSPLIGDILAYRDQDWIVVGMFMGADPATKEVEAFLVLEGQPAKELKERERREERGRAL